MPSFLFSLNLKRLRQSRHLTQEQLAEECDVSKNYISQLEMGKRFPSASMLDTICQALDAKAFELFIEESEAYKVMVVNKNDYALMDSLKNYMKGYLTEKE